MKTINVSDEMYNFLIDLSREINTQDHRSTAMPYFFQIKTKKEVACPDGCGNEKWFRDDHTIESEEEINEEILEIKGESTDLGSLNYRDKESILEDNGWVKIHYTFEKEYKNAFLTEKACKAHIKANDYHYNEPVDYLSFAFRNPELEMIFKFLCELTNGELHK